MRRKMGDLVSLVAEAGVGELFVDSDDLVTEFDETVIEGFDAATLLPISVGLEIQF